MDMFSRDDDDRQGLVLALVPGLVAAVTALVVGMALRQSAGPVPQAAAFAAPLQPVQPWTTASSSRPPASASADFDPGDASVIVQSGVVKFYFAPNQFALAAGGKEALMQVAAAVAGGKKAVVTGFHDATGNPARNAELARQRALTVRQALNALGISNARIELKKPEQSQTSGSDAEARRVEISVQ